VDVMQSVVILASHRKKKEKREKSKDWKRWIVCGVWQNVQRVA